MEKAPPQNPRSQEFLEELQKQLLEPVHKRLMGAHKGENPVQSMESELAKILLEIVTDEN